MYLFFFNDTATTEIYTLSLHDALPICPCRRSLRPGVDKFCISRCFHQPRSEEHTSELQSRSDLVCRLLLEKKKKSTTDEYILIFRLMIRMRRYSLDDASSAHTQLVLYN